MFPIITQLGYGAIQGEIASPRFVDGWIGGGIESFGEAAGSEGLEVRQFVLHYLLEVVTDPTHRIDDTVSDVQAIGERLSALPACNVLTIPIGPSSAFREGELHDFVTTLLTKLPTPVRIALEALPGSSIATPPAMTAFLAAFSPDRLGVNLDTGHLWSQGVPPEQMVEAVGAHRIFGTHICDNDGSANDSLAPGRGTIDWPRFFRILSNRGYDGPIDVEIRVPEAEIQTEYATARTYIESLSHISQP